MELKIKIKLLRMSYIIQIILLIIIISSNSLYKNRIDWMNRISTIFFYVLYSCLIIIVFFIISLLIIIFFQNSYYIIFKLLKISSALFAIRIFISCGFFIIYLLTNSNLKKFYIYCPFNYVQTDLTSIFPGLDNNIINKNDGDIKNKCLSRRCFEYDNIGKKLFYICNFNSEKDDINCKEVENNDYNGFSEIMISYINLCNLYTDIFQCNLNNKPKEFSIENDYICPEIKNKSFGFEIVLTIVNFLFPISIYILQFTLYKKILKLIVTQEIQRHNDTNANKTIDSSKKIDTNKSNTFKKEKTEVIIVDNANNNKCSNLFQILQKNKDSNKKILVKVYKRELLSKVKEKNFFKNQNKINAENIIINKSFTKNTNDLNVNNNFESNSIRLLTEINKNINNESEKKTKEKDRVRCILIKK